MCTYSIKFWRVHFLDVFYRVTVVTGMELGGSSAGGVYIELIGENGTSGIRCLKRVATHPKPDEFSALFSMGSVSSSFITLTFLSISSNTANSLDKLWDIIFSSKYDYASSLWYVCSPHSIYYYLIIKAILQLYIHNTIWTPLGTIISFQTVMNVIMYYM